MLRNHHHRLPVHLPLHAELSAKEPLQCGAILVGCEVLLSMGATRGGARGDDDDEYKDGAASESEQEDYR